MSRRFWRARHNIRDYYGVYHQAPPPQPEDVQAIAQAGTAHAFRFIWRGDRTASSDLPFGANGLLMNLRAAGVLLPMLTPWTSIQSDVLVADQHSHVLAVVTQVYDAMNTATTLGRRGSRSGIWIEVSELHLIGSKIGPSPIFRVPNSGVQWDYILSDEIVTAIQANGLTGLQFQEVVVED
jgi:hypothetical protein